ncbi:hypothetical protein L2E82_39385 [Cichorium intybus]|uniref:Uncharacterized protein n=1 Tax=Cichorium intybus TaxID=13427 RepID=A0ACB9AHC3_CICIN|nr:hypothetical protein L2E82_39385 [Cichorium intybus]
MNGKTLKKLALKSFGSQKSVMVVSSFSYLCIYDVHGVFYLMLKRCPSVAIRQSFVPDTESVSSADDLENKDRIEDDRLNVAFLPKFFDVADVEDSPNGAKTKETQPCFNENKNFDGPRRARIELSLCGNLLRPGMGISTAAETFNTHCIPS